ncbi:zinc finger BED domain-containing protein RICESLEEPER 2 [Tanacetum coccineum]
MKEKFDKYWGECNMLMCIACILDPRCKFTMLNLYFKDTYTKEEIDQKNEDLKELLGKNHVEYATLLWPKQGNSTSVSNSCGQSQRGKNEHASQGKGFSYYYSHLKKADIFYLERSYLHAYLEEGIYLCKDNPTISFDILDWWKSHEMKFPILSIMAAHILAIAITTMASKATFSAGGRVIDTYRASLKPDTVQVLIYGGDWFRKLHDIKKKSKVFDQVNDLITTIDTRSQVIAFSNIVVTFPSQYIPHNSHVDNKIILTLSSLSDDTVSEYKFLHDEIERISKESKDVSNESKTVDKACNDAFEVKQEMSKRIVELEKDLSKSETKGIAFEIALQHKSRENNSLKTVQKENEVVEEYLYPFKMNDHGTLVF